MSSLNYNQEKKNYFERLKEFQEEKVPILKGCGNRQCFCTGACKEVVGYRDKTPEEKARLNEFL